MYAIIKTGGKQYRVTKGEKLKLEKLDAEIGKKVVFNEVLSVGEGADLEIGTPYLEDTTVEAKVLDEGKSKKIEVVKFKSCLLYTSPSPRDGLLSRMPSSA